MAGVNDRLRVFQRGEVPVFGGEYLPLTMELARLARTTILPALTGTPAEWAYEDRVLVMLVPSLRENVGRFHTGDGPDLATTFREHQIDHMDRGLVAEILSLVDRLSPTMAAALARAVAPPDRPDS
jgi:hypothetical protein